MNSWFANISVNLKLGLGFGLVLILTGLLALTGWTSLGSLIDRSNWMGDIGQLNKDLTDLRIARLQQVGSCRLDVLTELIDLRQVDDARLEVAFQQ